MTAKETWSWESPTSYWTPFWGSAIVLPNGDMMGVFGPPTNQFQQNSQNQQLAFNDTGAVTVEINLEGQLVRTYTLPEGWRIYRVQQKISSQVSIPEYHSSAIFAVGFLLITVMVVAVVIQFRNKRKKDGFLPIDGSNCNLEQLSSK